MNIKSITITANGDPVTIQILSTDSEAILAEQTVLPGLPITFHVEDGVVVRPLDEIVRNPDIPVTG